MHAYTLTHTQTHINTHTHTYLHSYMHTNTHNNTQTYPNTQDGFMINATLISYSETGSLFSMWYNNKAIVLVQMKQLKVAINLYLINNPGY